MRLTAPRRSDLASSQKRRDVRRSHYSVRPHVFLKWSKQKREKATGQPPKTVSTQFSPHSNPIICSDFKADSVAVRVGIWRRKGGIALLSPKAGKWKKWPESRVCQLGKAMSIILGTKRAGAFSTSLLHDTPSLWGGAVEGGGWVWCKV